MTFYFSYAKFFALYIEINYQLGVKPLFSMEKFRNETIIGLPIAQIIFTPFDEPNDKAHTYYETGNTTLS